MPKISDEMTLYDIADAINRGELDREDPEVNAAVRERMRIVHEEFKTVDAIAPTDRGQVKPIDVGRMTRRLRAVADEEQREQARQAVGRIEDALGPAVRGKKRFHEGGGS